MNNLQEVIKINNLTLSINTNYLLNNQSQIILGQLLDFQVNHICQHLNIPIENELGLKIPRNILIKLIIEKGDFELEYDCQICPNLGLSKLPKDRFYSFRNIGGKPLIQFELDDSFNRLKDYSNDVFDRNNSEIYPIDLEIDNRLYISQIEKTLEKKQAFVGLIQEMITDEMTLKNERIDLAKLIISNPKNFYDYFGKIVGVYKSSYSDVILTLIIMNKTLLNNFIYRNNKNLNKIFLKKNFPNWSEEERKSFIRERPIFDEIFDKYVVAINDGNIVTSDEFRAGLSVFKKYKSLINFNYTNNKTSIHPIHFFKDILKLYLNNYTNYSTLNKFYINSENPIIFKDKSQIDTKDIIYKSKTIVNNSNNIIFNLEGKILQSLITRNRNRNLTSDTEKIFCNICNEYRARSDINHAKWHTSNNILAQELMNYQFDSLGSEYECLDDNYEIKIIGNGTLNIINKKNREIMGEIEAIERDIIQKFDRAFYMYTIENTETIVFNMNRNQERVNSNLTTMIKEYNEIKFEPQQFVSDKNNKEYKLNAIITDNGSNYQLFINLEKSKDTNIWLIFDSKFNTEIHSDFYQEIGSYAELIKFNNEYIKKHGIFYLYTAV